MKRLSRLSVAILVLFFLTTAPSLWGRTWKSANGRFTCDAEFVKFVNKDTVILKRNDNGKELTIKIEALCTADRDLLRKKWVLEPKFKSDYEDNGEDTSTGGKKYPINIDRTYTVGQQCKVWGSIVLNIQAKGSVGHRKVAQQQLNGSYRFDGIVKVDAVSQDGEVSEWSVRVNEFLFFDPKGKRVIIKPKSVVKGVATPPGEPTDYRIGGQKLSKQDSDMLNTFVCASVGSGVFLDEFFNSSKPRSRNESWQLDPNETYQTLKRFKAKGVERKPIPGKVQLVGVSKIRGTELVMIKSSVRFPYVLGVEKVKGQTTTNRMVVAATQYRPIDPRGRYCRTKGKTVVCRAERLPQYGKEVLVDIVLTYKADIQTYRSK